MDFKSKPVILAYIVIAVIIIAAGFWYWSQKKAEVPEEKGAVGAAKTVGESVPEIQTNVGEKVPEVNPLDRANPFKYLNPLR